MPVPLIYDIGVNGADKVKSALRGVEADAKASASRVASDSRRAARPRGNVDPGARQAARGFDQIGRAARAADNAAIRARMAGDKRANAARLKQIADEERAGVRAAEKAAAAQQRTATRIGTGVARSVGGSVKKVVGFGANALAIGGGLLGGVAATGAIESEIEIRSKASALANQARRPELKGALAKESKGVAGFTGMESLGALEQFVNITGDLDAARKLLPDLGKLALATGADIGELGATAGNAFIPLADQIKDPVERIKQMKDVMAALAGQGAVGAVEIKQLASYFAGLAATSNRFVGNKSDLLKTMGAITQAARQRGGAADAAEAVTSTERFSSDIIKKSGALGKLGVNVFADKGHTQLADPQEIITRVLEKTKGNLSTVSEIFGERGIRAIQGFSPLFTEAERRKPGSGRAAVAAEFSRLKGAQFSNADIERGAQSRLGDEDLQVKESIKKFNDAVGTKLIPVLTELIPKFTEAIPKLADFAGAVADLGTWLINNPWTGLGVAVGGVITKDLLSAGIGAMVESTLASILAGVAARGGVAAVAGSGVSALAGAVTAGAGATGGALGLGAAGTAGLAVGAAGAAAAAAVATAGYLGYKLSEDIDKLKGEEGNQGKGFWEIMAKGPSKGTSRDEYDRLYPPQTGAAPAPGQDKQSSTALNGQKVGKEIGDAAGNAIVAKLSGVALASNAPSARRTNPIIDR